MASLNGSSIASLATATKLVSQATKAKILDQIKLASGYSKLTSDQQTQIKEVLITKLNDPNGTLKVIINYESETYKLSASGFLPVVANNIAKVKTFLSNLSNSDLNFLTNANKLVRSINKARISRKIRLAKGYSALTNAQKALVKKRLITKNEDTPGTLKIIINFEGKSYEFKIVGFKLTNAQNKKRVKDFLGGLPSTLIDSLSEPTKLVSAVTKAEILTKIKEARGYSNLTSAQQRLIKEDLITIANDPDGTLKVTILFDGETYEYSKDSFKLLSVHNIEQVKAFLGSLNGSSIASLATTTKLVSQVTKTKILTKIQATRGYGALTNNQKTFITKDLILPSEDPNGTLKVTIKFKGETYVLIKDGFKLTLEAKANKFKNFNSTDTTKPDVAILETSSKTCLISLKKLVVTKDQLT